MSPGKKSAVQKYTYLAGFKETEEPISAQLTSFLEQTHRSTSAHTTPGCLLFGRQTNVCATHLPAMAATEGLHSTLLLEAQDLLSESNEVLPQSLGQALPKKPIPGIAADPFQELPADLHQLMAKYYYPPVTHSQQIEYRQNWKRKFRSYSKESEEP
jgi:hypothetical protein